MSAQKDAYTPRRLPVTEPEFITSDDVVFDADSWLHTVLTHSSAQHTPIDFRVGIGKAGTPLLPPLVMLRMECQACGVNSTLGMTRQGAEQFATSLESSIQDADSAYVSAEVAAKHGGYSRDTACAIVQAVRLQFKISDERGDFPTA